AEDGIRDRNVTGVQTCALPISGIFFRLLPKCRASFSSRRLPISLASSRSCSLIQWRILLFADDDFTKLSQSRLGWWPFCVRISRSEERRVGEEGRFGGVA